MYKPVQACARVCTGLYGHSVRRGRLYEYSLPHLTHNEYDYTGMTILLNCHDGTQTLEERGNLDQLNYLYLVIHPILLALHRHSCLVILVLRVLTLAWEPVYLLSV